LSAVSRDRQLAASPRSGNTCGADRTDQGQAVDDDSPRAVYVRRMGDDEAEDDAAGDAADEDDD
jgi:hypothetical protein